MSGTKGHVRRALLVVVVVIGASLFPTAANAQFPGDNGELAFGRLSPNGPDGIATMPQPGGQPTLISRSRGFDREPSYTADGTRLLFVRKVDVWTMNADGSDAEKVTDSRAREFCPSWSPDGTTIVFDRAGDLWTVELGASVPHRLTRTRAREFCPSWSPDGTTIAFVLDGPGPNKFDIALMDADGTNRRRVTADRETSSARTGRPMERASSTRTTTRSVPHRSRRSVLMVPMAWSCSTPVIAPSVRRCTPRTVCGSRSRATPTAGSHPTSGSWSPMAGVPPERPRDGPTTSPPAGSR